MLPKSRWGGSCQCFAMLLSILIIRLDLIDKHIRSLLMNTCDILAVAVMVMVWATPLLRWVLLQNVLSALFEAKVCEFSCIIMIVKAVHVRRIDTWLRNIFLERILFIFNFLFFSLLLHPLHSLSCIGLSVVLDCLRHLSFFFLTCLCLTLDLRIVQEPFRQEIDRVVWLSIVHLCETFANHLADAWGHQVLWIWYFALHLVCLFLICLLFN